MKLVRVRLTNIGCLPDGEYSFLDRHTGRPLAIALVTGAACSGKTTLLEAVVAAKEAAGAYAPPADARPLLRRGADRGAIEATWAFDEQEIARLGLREGVATTRLDITSAGTKCRPDASLTPLFASFSTDPTRAKFAYFADNRSLPANDWRPSGPTISAQAEARLHLGRTLDKYQPLVRHFVDLAVSQGLQATAIMEQRGVALRASAPDSFAELRRLLAILLPHLRFCGVGLADGAPRVLFERADGSVVDLERLSALERQCLIFAGTFWRVGLHRSVVLVDTPELHAHPRVQVGLVRAIEALGHHNQLIIATSSEAIQRELAMSIVARLGTGPA